MALFRNFYRCDRCGNEWTDVWSATCDDDCPQCGARHLSPYKSEDADDVPRSSRIAEFNDALRRTFVGGRVVMTAAVNALPADETAQVLAKVQSFDEFDADNDPHGERDFGSFDIGGETFFWKVDYYSPDMEGGSEDPSDPSKTTRVLTIMLASEY